MQRHAKTKFRKKSGAPFMGMMNKKLHAKAHERMGMGESKEVEDTKVKGPARAPEAKKEEN